jgi:thioredoxin 1
MSNATAVTEDTFEQEVIKSETPVLVDFWAEWCGPCKMMAPILDQVADEQAGRLRIVKVDVDAYPDFTDRYQILGIPTMILFKDGQPVERLSGFMPKARLLQQLSPHI